MRCIKLIAILSLGLFFFGVLTVVHLCISVLRLPNRWKIVSGWLRGFTWLISRILNINIAVEGDAGQLERGGYMILSNHFGYLDGIVRVTTAFRDGRVGEITRRKMGSAAAAESYQ